MEYEELLGRIARIIPANERHDTILAFEIDI